jgi:hypothetical protein
MAIARKHLVDTSLTRWYHCVTRCVRRAFLLGEGPCNRKEWIENRLEELAQIFAVAVGGFSILDNHLHLLLRLDPDIANAWSDEEVVRRWGRLFPPRDKSRQALPVTNDWVQWRLKDIPWVATARDRLQSLSTPFSLGSYLLLVDYTGRLFREGKATISAELSGIFNRLNSSAENWWTRLEKLSRGRLLGRFFAASRDRLREVAARLGVHHLANLGGCLAR